MKVESVEAFPLRVKVNEKLDAGTFSYADYQTVLVRTVSDGVEGWGEAMTRFDPRITALMVRYLGKELLRKSFESVSASWDLLWRMLRVRGHTRGLDVEALSGIEIALQDSYARAKRLPLCRILAKSPATEVRAFAGSLFESRGAFEDQVQKCRTTGLAGAKIKVGFGVAEDARVLRKIRGLWPDGMLVADANGAYAGPAARKACAAFKEFDLAWFEEPVLSDDLDGYRLLRDCGIRIGAGESWFPGDFDGPMKGNLVDVLEPSVSRCGGIAVEASVASRAERLRLGFSPMNGMNSLVSVAASLHLAAAFANEGVEFNPFRNPLQWELGEGIGEAKGGLLMVPQGPGLGITLDLGYVKRHTF